MAIWPSNDFDCYFNYFKSMKFNKILLFLIDWVWHLHLVPKVVHAILPIRFPACCEGSIIQLQWPTAKPTATPPKFLTTLPREKWQLPGRRFDPASGFRYTPVSSHWKSTILMVSTRKNGDFPWLCQFSRGKGQTLTGKLRVFPTENSRFGHLAVERTARQPPRLPTTRRRPRSSATHKPQPL